MAGFRFNINTSSSGGGPTGIIGKLGATLFFGIFLAAGLFFEVMVFHQFVDTAATYQWTAAPCTIIESRIAEDLKSDRPFELVVSYRYAVDGKAYTSSQYSKDKPVFDKYIKVQHLLDQYPKGAQTRCYVNPADASEAVIRRGSLLFGFTLLFPLIFVAVGGGGIFFTWRGSIQSSRTDAPLVSKKSSSTGRTVGLLFFGVFALVGGGLSWFLLVNPVIKYSTSASWVETPCVIESSRVRSHDSDDGTTYSVDILYRYEFNGRTYKSNQYDFMGGSSSGYRGKEDVVRQYPRGKKTMCFVNPDDPAEAVLHRGFSPMMLFGLIPLVFLVIGVGGLIFMFKSGSKDGGSSTFVITERGARGRRTTYSSNADDDDTGPVTLKPTESRYLKLIGVLFFALFWNGIVSVFVYQVVDGFVRGDPEWFLTIFMIPFVAIGLGAIGFVFYTFLSLFNPQPTVTVNRQSIPLGGALDVAWDIVGKAERIRTLRITLEGREEATYRRGTNTHTDKNTFRTLELRRTEDPVDLASGAASITIPVDTMHSFEASNNKIVWTLKVHGDIPRWPDVNVEFKINVLPAELEGQSA